MSPLENFTCRGARRRREYYGGGIFQERAALPEGARPLAGSQQGPGKPPPQGREAAEEATLARIGLRILGCGVLLAAVAAGASPGGAEEPQKPEKSFETFAGAWVRGLEREAEKQRAVGPAGSSAAASYTYRSYGSDIQTRLKRTGNAAAPFVGVLSYTENTWLCRSGPRGPQCEIVDSSPVTELFPFEDGEWHY